ncbi:MAG: hypothetical protein WD795_13010 [Woeseia sp.]
MTRWSRRLIGVGLLLILAGFVFALLFGWSTGHQARLVAHDAYQPLFEQIAGTGGGDGEWRAVEEEISRNSITQRRAADVHGHSINMGILLILIGLLSSVVNRNGGIDNRLLFSLAVTAVVYPAGLFLQFLGLKLAGEVVSAIGAAGAVATLAVLYWRFSRAVDNLPG